MWLTIVSSGNRLLRNDATTLACFVYLENGDNEVVKGESSRDPEVAIYLSVIVNLM